MTDTLIVPGLNGSPPGHWQHHWAAADANADIVEQESWTRPVLSDWLHALEARIMGTAPGVVLVAHSLGCALVAALANRPSAAHVSGALLVAPADAEALSQRHPTLATFATASKRRLPFDSLLLASRDDPFMEFARAERQADLWGSAFYDMGWVGHINIASGFGPWADGPVLADGLRGRNPVVLPESIRSRSWWRDVRPQSRPSRETGFNAV